MNIAILGFGVQGQSSLKYWDTPDNHITICDGNKSVVIPKGVSSHLGPKYLANLDKFDLLIRTPILHPKDIIAANPESPDILNKVTSNTNEFFRVCPTKNIIGVTGTKGKGTTSTLIAKMLEADSKKVHVGGNIGTPPLDLLKNNIQTDDWIVLELANFQLIDIHHAPHISICLMVVPEHLDWHEDYEEYVAAKQQVFMNQSANDIAIYYSTNEDSESIAGASVGELIPYYHSPGAYVKGGKIVIDNNEICSTSEIKLLGKHNWQNICAAVTTVWQVTHNVEAIKSVITSFTGLPFRIELRAEKNGIRYYNDSFASAAGATIAALKAIPGMKVMIIGGFDRGLDLTGFAKEIEKMSSEIRKIVLIGAASKRTSDALEMSHFDNYTLLESKDMENIVNEATNYAEKGDAVVLSPAFASFDMFKNFEDRGNKFNDVVDSL